MTILEGFVGGSMEILQRIRCRKTPGPSSGQRSPPETLIGRDLLNSMNRTLSQEIRHVPLHARFVADVAPPHSPEYFPLNMLVRQSPLLTSPTTEAQKRSEEVMEGGGAKKGIHRGPVIQCLKGFGCDLFITDINQFTSHIHLYHDLRPHRT